MQLEHRPRYHRRLKQELEVMNSLKTILLLCVVNAAFGRYYHDNVRSPQRQYYEQRDKDKNPFESNIPLPSDFDDDVTDQLKHDDPHHYRPLPLPMKDAIRYVRKYGRHAESLRKFEDELRRLPRSHVMLDQLRNEKRSPFKCQTRPKDKACKRDVNGCGSGFTASLPLFYREEFTPCCNKHDVCYDCGVTRHWTREQCDNKFYDDMENTCSCLYPSWYQYPAYKTCKLWASTLYAVVDVFSASYFGTKVKDVCKSKCILPYGSPQISLLG
eukprot:TCONS_00057945-protein